MTKKAKQKNSDFCYFICCIAARTRQSSIEFGSSYKKYQDAYFETILDISNIVIRASGTRYHRRLITLIFDECRQ